MDTPTLVSWAKYIAVALPLIGASGTVIIYAEELKNSIGDIRKEQKEIRKSQASIIGTMDTRFNKIETGHDRLDDTIEDTGKTILESMVTLGIEVGRVSGRQERE